MPKGWFNRGLIWLIAISFAVQPLAGANAAPGSSPDPLVLTICTSAGVIDLGPDGNAPDPEPNACAWCAAGACSFSFGRSNEAIKIGREAPDGRERPVFSRQRAPTAIVLVGKYPRAPPPLKAV